MKFVCPIYLLRKTNGEFTDNEPNQMMSSQFCASFGNPFNLSTCLKKKNIKLNFTQWIHGIESTRNLAPFFNNKRQVFTSNTTVMQSLLFFMWHEMKSHTFLEKNAFIWTKRWNLSSLVWNLCILVYLEYC